MSENSQKKSAAPLIVTIVVAVLAVAVVAVLIFVLKKPEPADNSSSESGFVVTQEFEQECQKAAGSLVTSSFDVMRLYVFEGLSYMGEPYGNEPEDGLYSVYTEDNAKYTTLEDIEKLVKSVYTESAADKIMHNIDGNGLEVFKNRKVLEKAEYDSEPDSSESRPEYIEKEVLGISASFKPDTSKRDLWADCSIMLTSITENKCEMKIYLGGVEDSEDLSEVSSDSVVNLEMVKTAAGWRLSAFVC